MRPLPRLHAITDGAVLAMADLGVRAAAIAAAGPAVALHVRDRSAGGRRLAEVTTRFHSLTVPPGAALFVNGHPEIAAAASAHGVQLGSGDLTVPDARRVFPHGWIGRSVHTLIEAETAIREDADYLLVGTIFPTASHPGRPGAGIELLRSVAALGRPVIAIGGIDADRAAEARAAGAYGVAAIAALWHATDPAAAALALLGPWMDLSDEAPAPPPRAPIRRPFP